MRVLITGAAGRIGACLTAGLSRLGHQLVLTDIRPPEPASADCEFRPWDLSENRSPLPLVKGVDAVIHLAGHPNSRDWDVLSRINIEPTRRVLEACTSAGVRRVLYASSIHVAGAYPAETPLADSLPPRPGSPYGVSKAQCETLLRYFSDVDGLSAISLRICSFRPQPTNARELRTWLSPADMIRLSQAGLTASLSGFAAVWGVSNNRRANVELLNWSRIGYRPEDDAERFAADLQTSGIDTRLVSEWPTLGGPFTKAASA